MYIALQFSFAAFRHKQCNIGVYYMFAKWRDLALTEKSKQELV